MADDEDLEPVEDTDEDLVDQAGDDQDARVRFGRLKLMSLSPAHYLAHPDGDSAAREKGTAVHQVLLQGKSAVCWTEKNKGGKTLARTSDKFKVFAQQHAGKLILLPTAYEPAMRMIDAVRANRQAMDALGGVREQTLLFEMLGLDCRSTPDARAPGWFTELKTTMSSAPWRFGWQAKKMGYAAQMAFHAEAIRRNKLGDGKVGYIVAVESSAPFPVTVFKVTPATLEKGAKQIHLWLEQLKGCLAANQWPPYAQDVVELEVPGDEIDIPGAVEGGSADIPF